MNNLSTRIEGNAFEIVNKCHYTLTEDDFDGYGLHIETRKDGVRLAWGDPLKGYQRLMGVPLDTPLCGGCDREIVNAVCPDCELLFADLLPLTEVHPDPLRSIAP